MAENSLESRKRKEEREREREGERERERRERERGRERGERERGRERETESKRERERTRERERETMRERERKRKRNHVVFRPFPQALSAQETEPKPWGITLREHHIWLFLGKEKDGVDYESCLEAMKKDSQGKSEALSKEKLASAKKKNPITQELINKIDKYFLDFGLPITNEFDSVFR